MFITMLGDMTAFLSLVFGYFFYWTARPDFIPDDVAGPGVLWPSVALALLLAAWALTMGGRTLNRRDSAGATCATLGLGALLACAGGGALLAGPWVTGLDPESHVYPAIVWVLAIWAALHAFVGAVMQLYCLARRAAGRMTAEHDIDIANVTLYWHFAALTTAVTVAVIAGFPLVS
jgi:cytochrome c oxidase subunit I+III